jgi:hypothetical protein
MGAGLGDLPRLIILFAPSVLTLQKGEVSFWHTILLDQFTLTRLVPPLFLSSVPIQIRYLA